MKINKEHKNLFIVFSVLLTLSLGLIIYSIFPLITGQTIVLKTHPVDPFDIFRGQYLTIGYDISLIPKIDGVKEGDNVYVTLKREGDIYVYDSASLIKPKSNNLFLKGRVSQNFGLDKTLMRVEYGVESYYFERNAQINTVNMTVELKVASSGSARISRLLHEGKPLEINYTKSTFS